jgi:hypothetical protein
MKPKKDKTIRKEKCRRCRYGCLTTGSNAGVNPCSCKCHNPPTHPKKEGWEKELREIMNNYDDDGNPNYDMLEIKSFISKLLKEEREKIADEIEGELGRFYTENPKGKFRIIIELEDLQNLLDRVKTLKSQG